ncbi:hypothetical protein BH11BAC4_BH11BAC4_21450 [soil metagenome]
MAFLWFVFIFPANNKYVMKNLSIVLNAVLVIAVGILYYFHFSGKKTETKSKVIAPKVMNTETAGHTAIAYVELDSLNENITYIKNKRKELEAEQKKIETEWESAYKGLEAKKNAFLKKGDAITQ